MPHTIRPFKDESRNYQFCTKLTVCQVFLLHTQHEFDKAASEAITPIKLKKKGNGARNV